MRKIILSFVLVALMCCALTIISSAAPYTFDFGEVEKIDFFENYAENNGGTDYITTVMGYPNDASKDARATVACTCEAGRHTYPTYYFMQEKKSDWLDLFRKDCVNINANNPCGATYDKDSFLAIEVPEGIADFWGQVNVSGAFMNHTKLVYVSIPSTMESMHVNTFRGCSSLEWVDFGENNKITTLDHSAFNGCTALKGVCLPDSIKTMQNATFIGCVNLGPVHLPDNLTTFGTATDWNTFQCGQNGNGAKLTKLFFTNERFDNPDEVEKPEVYYMPSGFSGCGDQLFRGLSNINNIVVFPTTYTSVYDSRSFIGLGGTEEQPKTVVFLGDMTSFLGYADPTSSYTNFVFANPNDTAENVPYSFTFEGSHSNISMYSCASKQWGAAYQTVWTSEGFTHFAEPKSSVESVPGNCTTASKLQAYCFCGSEIGLIDGEIDADAHEFGLASGASVVQITYTAFDQSGTKHIKCARCESVDTSAKADPVFEAKGYSTNSDKTSLNGGFYVNLDNLNAYEQINNKNITYGIIIANANSFSGEMLDGANKVNSSKAIQVEIDSLYSSFDCSINFGTTQNNTLELVICAYVIDGDNVTFIQADTAYAEETAIGANTFKKVTLDKVVANQPAETKEEE